MNIAFKVLDTNRLVTRVLAELSIEFGFRLDSLSAANQSAGKFPVIDFGLKDQGDRLGLRESFVSGHDLRLQIAFKRPQNERSNMVGECCFPGCVSSLLKPGWRPSVLPKVSVW